LTSPSSTSHPLPRPPADTAPPPVPAVLWHQAAAEAPVGPTGSELPSGAALLVVAAHPDDEAIGAGRLLADHDGPVRCLTLTAGERCHGSGTDTGQVARTRLREWREALAVLGATPLETPRWPDGRLADHEQEAAEALSALAAEAGAVLAPWRHDPHPDHEAAGRIAAAAARRAGVPCWSYLVWTPYWLSPADARRGRGRAPDLGAGGAPLARGPGLPPLAGRRPAPGAPARGPRRAARPPCPPIPGPGVQ
jgi:LmbE family N-acetylglucosaminyl deacetylase